MEVVCLAARHGQKWCYVGRYSECSKIRQYKGKYVSEEACEENTSIQYTEIIQNTGSINTKPLARHWKEKESPQNEYVEFS